VISVVSVNIFGPFLLITDSQYCVRSSQGSCMQSLRSVSAVIAISFVNNDLAFLETIVPANFIANSRAVVRSGDANS